MAKAFSVASWNVEHFGASDVVKDHVIKFLADQKADVVAVFEVRSSAVFQPLVDAMPGYQFHITEGPKMQEILVGVRNKFSGFVTQKLEFKAGQSSLRPGVLLTLTIDGKYYPLLFLHLKSMRDAKGHGLRYDMLQRALDFRKVLNKKVGGDSNFIFLGDLNTMGMNLTYSDKDLSGEEEIARLKKRAGVASVRMKVLDKTPVKIDGEMREATYWPGSTSSLPASNLDHVVAAEHLTFKKFGGFSIDARGWSQESSLAKRDAWAKNFSDHALLYFEVQKV